MEKINKSFGLGLVEFSESQKQTFLAILSLADRGLQHSWRVVDIEYADFFILATEKSESEAVINAKNLPRERCLFCTRQELPFSEYDTDVLFIASGGVPQLSFLVRVLNHVANISLSTHIPANNLAIKSIVETQQQAIVLSNEATFNPEQGFLNYLLPESSARKEFRFGSLDTIYRLYVDFVKKVYYCETSLTELSALIIQDSLVVNVMMEAEWHDAVEPLTLPAKPLANLIWYVAFKLSKGRLLNGHSNQDNIYLSRWPDLSLDGCRKYINLAAFMCNNTVCLTTVAEKTAIPLEEVYSFYNACYLIGIVKKTDKPELHAKTFDEDKKYLLAKIANRLKEINSPQHKAG